MCSHSHSHTSPLPLPHQLRTHKANRAQQYSNSLPSIPGRMQSYRPVGSKRRNSTSYLGRTETVAGYVQSHRDTSHHMQAPTCSHTCTQTLTHTHTHLIARACSGHYININALHDICITSRQTHLTCMYIDYYSTAFVSLVACLDICSTSSYRNTLDILYFITLWPNAYMSTNFPLACVRCSALQLASTLA